jgi:hypothetical protein
MTKLFFDEKLLIKRKNNSMKIILLAGIIVGLGVISVEAQENCDGPVTVPGSITGSCSCDNTQTKCVASATITVMNDYVTCGGNGYSECGATMQTVGYTNPGCDDTFDVSALASLESAYEDCVRINNGSYPPVTCTPPAFCQWNTCAIKTSGGTPILRPVQNTLGDLIGCMLAKIQECPSLRVGKLVQAILTSVVC